MFKKWSGHPILTKYITVHNFESCDLCSRLVMRLVSRIVPPLPPLSGAVHLSFPPFAAFSSSE